MLPPLKNGPSGKQVWPLNPIGALDRQNFAITEKMKNPEVAIRWADFCYDLDNSYALCLGSWNIVLRRQGDKVIVNPAPEGMTDDEFRYKHSPAHTTPFAIPEVDYNKIASPPAVMRKLERLETYRKFFCPVDEIYPKVYFLPEEENELAIIRNDIRTHVNRFRASFVSGAEPLTTGWNAYVQEFNKMGLPKYLELYQKALDRYNAN
jgi:putative aldouronate transport system substrate-binding protein